MKPPFLNSVRVRNFKAIRNSGSVRLTPLTVFIGNNGSGKSSLIEALETFRAFVMQDLDVAMQMWRGIEHIRNKAVARQTRFSKSGTERSSKPIEIGLRGHNGTVPFASMSRLDERRGENEIFVQQESLQAGSIRCERDENSWLTTHDPDVGPGAVPVPQKQSILRAHLGEYIGRWQFLSLWPQEMGQPLPQIRTGGPIQLVKEGSNIAQYLLDIRDRSLPAFEGIIDAVRHVLPYARDVQPTLTRELERTVYLQLAERDFKVPGWLLSTGTLRILALLAVLRHPDPPPLLFIEEIENGLDPRTIHLLVDEIGRAVETRRMQVVVATHSPYLLDLLPLDSIVLVERIKASPVFSRPADDVALRKWAKEFSPGQLFTMNRMGRSGRQ